MTFAFKTVKDEFECSTAGRKIELYFQCSIEQQDEMGQLLYWIPRKDKKN